MGMMDRDYWKEKHNPNWNKKNRSVNPKYAKGLADLQKQLDRQSTPIQNFVSKKESYLKKYFYFLAIIIFVNLVFIKEDGRYFNYFIEKFQTFSGLKDSPALNNLKIRPKSKSIIAQDISIVQTDLHDDFDQVDIELNLARSLINPTQYFSKHSFYSDVKEHSGQLSYFITNVDKKNGIINGKIIFQMWGSLSITNPNSNSNKSGVCQGELKRDLNNGDVVNCNGNLTSSVHVFIKSKIGDKIILRLKNGPNKTLKAYYLETNGSFTEVGTVKYSPNEKISKILTHTLNSSSNISSCDELMPFSIEITSITNNGKNGRSFHTKFDENFACAKRIVTEVNNNKITQSVI